jgi:5-methylcytosine-specific restriction enzyme subunit McrC
MSELVELVEYQPKSFPREALSEEIARTIWQNHSAQVSIEPPSFRRDYKWQLKSSGYVGYLPITRDFTLALRPKVPLRNLFGMLEYAYRQDIQFFEGLIDCASLEEFYERLASVLAKRVIDRQHKGLHRKYVLTSERSAFVRGRLDLEDRIRRPWDVLTNCYFEEHTPEIEDNQILASTLRRIASGGVCSERVRPVIRTAYRGMTGIDAMRHFTGKSCTNRSYDRLNSDYKPLHSLCRFFLDHGGPEHGTGEYSMLPFLIDMNALFELFVAEWLRIHLPKGYSLEAQSRLEIGGNYNLEFVIDLVLTETKSGKVVCVLDTKYKREHRPDQADVEQVTAYAEAKRTDQAILVYPAKMSDVLDSRIGKIRVRSLTFSLADDLEIAGNQFLQGLFV